MGDDKAPELDDFIVKFFWKAWEMMGSNMVEVIRSFFATSYLLGKVNATSISLIP